MRRRPRVMLESPFNGPCEVHPKHNPGCLRCLYVRALCEAYLRRAMVDSISRGESPYASHLLLPQVLDEDDPEQRAIGMECGHAWLWGSEYVVAYVDGPGGVTPGMLERMNLARANSIRIELRMLS